LFKKGYKLIIIKDGQFDLKEFHLNPLTMSFILVIGMVPFILFYFIVSSMNSYSNANLNEIMEIQSKKIEFLESKNKLQADRLDNYEITIEKNISDNKQTLKSLTNQLKENQKRSDKIVKVLFNTEGLSKEIRKVGSGGQDSIVLDKPLDNSDLNKLYDQSRLLTKVINKMQRQINLEGIYIGRIEDRFFSNIDYWSAIPSRMPLNIKRGIYISSYYGYREDPIHKKQQFHGGDDFSADIGTPVRATGGGVVSKAKFDSRLGNYVEIDHGYGYKTVYAHMNKLSVKKGETVKRGQELGGVGNTGRSTAAHLHYEVKYNNKTKNPRPYYTYDKKLEDLIYYR
tara:strand:+ start:606 stop:1628 length:1023 start_codon:yes stop_codon:yes gene_type:complete